MDQTQRTYLITFGCVLGFLVTYFITDLNPVLLPWYYPLEHAWHWVVRPQTLAMDFYGRLLWSVVGTVPAGAVAVAVSRRWKPADANPTARALAIWTLALFLFVVALLMYQLLPRHPFPAALPPGYRPR
jgi:hypothetical protein